MGRKSARKQVAIQRATQLAAESKDKASASDVSDYVKKSKESLTFQIQSLQAQLKTLEELEGLTEEEKMGTLFHLFDKDGNGEVNGVEMADGLRKCRGDMNFEESIAMAVNRVAAYDKDANASLNLEEFSKFIHDFAKDMGSTFSDLAELLVMNVLFSKKGNTKQEERTARKSSKHIDAAVLQSVKKTAAAADKGSVKTRMHALFDLFDVDGDHKVDFKEVVVGMYKITENVDNASKASVNALMMFDLKTSRTMDFEQFNRFIVNVVATIPEVKFDDIADAITLAAAAGDEGPTVEEIAELFAMDRSMQQVMDLGAATQDEVDKLKGTDFGKANILFDLFDLDGNGTIEFQELALGLRKFVTVKSMEQTVEEAMKIMNDFDTDADQKLDRNEFALFLAKFAKTLGLDFMDMIDFMVVMAALKDNSDTEQKYIESLSNSDSYFWGM